MDFLASCCGLSASHKNESLADGKTNEEHGVRPAVEKGLRVTRVASRALDVSSSTSALRLGLQLPGDGLRPLLAGFYGILLEVGQRQLHPGHCGEAQLPQPLMRPAHAAALCLPHKSKQ